jgi:uncharacterized protein (DUF305 family)
MQEGSSRFTLYSTIGVSLALVAGLILGSLLGFAGGVTVGKAGGASSTPADNSPEAGFARDMSAHHAQAVAMGVIAQQRATTVAVRGLGGDIALTQQAQIGMMDQWLRGWKLNLNSSRQPMAWMPDGQNALDNGLMPGMATPEEMKALEDARGIEVDRLFIKMMIKHHLGGIHMVDGILKQSDNPDVKWLAESMKNGQQREITALQDLQRSVG